MAEEDLSPIMAFQHLNIPNVKKATQKIMRRIQKNKIVLDTLVINNFGLPGETTMKQMMATITSRVLKPFTMRCVHTIRDINPQDTPLTVRVTSTNYEILIIPGVINKKDFMLVVFHTPQPAPLLPYVVKTTRKR